MVNRLLALLTVTASQLVAGVLPAAEDGEPHWSSKPLVRPEVPEVADRGKWARNDIDRFVLARLEPLGLEPNPPIADEKLVRRLHFDLLGLPPSPEDLGRKPDVGALLDSTHYGERWGRHWLDVVRYGDSMGYRFDDDMPNAFQYRDFVIRAINSDMPFDRFVRWQIAGDELAPGVPAALAATGFAAIGPRERIEGTKRNRRETRYNEMDDIVSTAGSAFIAVTLNCARCHDHKIDPIPQAEYYGFVGAFMTAERKDLELQTPEEIESRKAWREREKELQVQVGNWYRDNSDELDPQLADLREPLQEESDKLWEKFLGKLSKKDRANTKKHAKLMRDRGRRLLGAKDDARYQKLEILLGDPAELISAHPKSFEAAVVKQLAQHRSKRPGRPAKALVFVDQSDKPTESPLLSRGSIDNPTDPVPLQFVSMVSRDPEYRPDVSKVANGPKSTYQRAALARWLTDVERGAGQQLARVMANRVWLYHFGEALAPNPNDFGHGSKEPAMPELLDHLASYLIDHEWSLKALHRHILDSATYRQGTAPSPAAEKADPENLFWHRRRPRKLEAEALRDSILTVSGRLNKQQFGPGALLPVPADEIISRLGKPYPKDIADAPPIWRRSVYTFIKRTVPVPFSRTFDAPDHSNSCGRRPHTTVAPQALHLMNNPLLRKRAEDFADRLRAEVGDDSEKQIRRAYLLALGRSPDEDELALNREFLKSSPLADFCHALFTLNEFIYVD